MLDIELLVDMQNSHTIMQTGNINSYCEHNCGWEEWVVHYHEGMNLLLLGVKEMKNNIKQFINDHNNWFNFFILQRSVKSLIIK